jgi:hypothetical protein
LDEIKPRRGMEVVKIKQPADDKIERLRKHRKLLRDRLVQVARGAPWLDDFIAEVTLFPHTAFDDQVDAMTQYLQWITTNPKPQKREAMGLVAVSQRWPRSPSGSRSGMQTTGCVVVRHSDHMFNVPFRLPEVTVRK